jgi:hypothetical protein
LARYESRGQEILNNCKIC